MINKETLVVLSIIFLIGMIIFGPAYVITFLCNYC